MGEAIQLVVSVIPKNLDVWAWEKYYKQEAVHHVQVTPVSLQKVDIELPTKDAFHGVDNIEDEESDQEAGIFERKEYLIIYHIFHCT